MNSCGIRSMLATSVAQTTTTTTTPRATTAFAPKPGAGSIPLADVGVESLNSLPTRLNHAVRIIVLFSFLFYVLLTIFSLFCFNY